jgi:uncharacterized protein (DUF2141 family)
MLRRATTSSVGAGLAWLAAATLGAQQPRDGGPPPSAFTASIVGKVTTVDGRPLGRAVVTARTELLPLGRSTISDDAGSFAIQRLPAGRTTITAERHGFLSATYGATRPGRPGTPVMLAAGQTMTVAIRMTRGGVITGTIRNTRGQPVPDLRVQVLNARSQVEPQSVSFAMAVSSESLTDERGVFRVVNLDPGEYIVAAIPFGPITGTGSVTRTVEEVDAILATLERAGQTGSLPERPALPVPYSRPAAPTNAPIFYPGTPTLAEASRITLTAGDERAGIDFVVQPVPVSTIEGRVTASGASTKYQISISSAGWQQLGMQSTAAPRLSDGGSANLFRYTNVIPGRYRILARGNPTWANDLPPGVIFGDAAAMLYGEVTVDVGAGDVSDVELQLRPGARLVGRVVFDSAAAARPGFGQLRVSAIPDAVGAVVRGSTTMGDAFREARHAVPDSSGHFEIAGLAPGRYRVQVQVSGEASRWWLRSASVGGRDLLDTGLDAASGLELTGATLLLTDRQTELSGVLQSSTGLPAPDYFVIAFPADTSLRLPNSRRLRSTRPATDGSFSFANLPPGTYLLAALTDVDPDEWQKPEFLEALVPSTLKIALGEGERRRQDLRIGR